MRPKKFIIMHPFITKHATGKKVLFFVILANIIYAIMVFITIPKVSAFVAGLKILDMMPSGYDFEYVKSLFENLGEEGRTVYLWQQIPLDLIYPFLFALSNFLLLAYLLKKIEVKNQNLYRLCLIPVFGGLFDYMENFGTILLLRSFPEISQTQVTVNNFFTILKSGFVTLFFIVLIATFFVFVYKKIKTLRSQ